MIQTRIIYEGTEFAIGGRSAAEVKETIRSLTENGASGWLSVNYGQGDLREAELMVGPGIGIAVYEIKGDED